MKPVEIEFLMKDGLSAGLDKTGLAVEILATKSEKAAALINTKIQEQKKAIDQVTSDLLRMEKQLSDMKPGTAQEELAVEVSACRKVLDEERGSLQQLEKEHAVAEKAVQGLRKEYEKISLSEERATAENQTLTDRIREQKAVIKQVEADVKALEKAYRDAAPGNSQLTILDELNAAKKALQEDKNLLSSYQAEQERTRVSSKRLSMQLRELQDNMAKMRLEGKKDTDEYHKMAAEAANLSDTIADLNTQTKILSNDDANLQGFMSGVSGLAGIFTTATGALSLFASENENLAKIQTRVQSVMAITMGLQQVFNTLNKDSAFRLVTVVKMKNLLTAANTRLATSLGISTVAAQALMATLTLGLSVVITGLIVAWDKYSDAQEKAAEKAQERVKIESDGRAQMIKTRFEIDNTLESLKKFNGSKKEEKAKVEELNRKFGESFGYYDTVSQWYDILIEKSDAYIQMLFLQAKAQSMVNKAAELDAKVAEAEAKPTDDYSHWYDGVLATWQQGMWNMTKDEKYNPYKNSLSNMPKNRKDEELSELRNARDEYIEKAQEEMRQAAEVAKGSGIGGHVKPTKPNASAEKKELQAEQQRADKLRRLQIENRQAELDRLKENAAKKRRQVELNYDKEILTAKEKEKELLKLYDTDNTGDKMFKAFGTGNVDVLARPLVDAAELVKKGWEDAGEGIATVYSSQFGVEDAEGKSHEILITPILPDGTVLSPDELESYIDNTLNGAEDILSADSKGLVIKVDATLDGNDGELLHQLQEKFYDVPESVLEELSALYSNAVAGRDKGLTDITKEQLQAEQQSLNDYLKEYGTFQQRKLAIAEEYAEKIRLAQEKGNPNEVKRLEKESSVAQAGIDAEAIKADIDWAAVFGDFGGMFRDIIKTALDDAEKYVRTDDFKNADPASQNAVISAINQMKKSIGSAGGLDFKKLGQQVQIYQDSLRELEQAKAEEIEAINRLKKAQEEYGKALKEGTDSEKEAAETALSNAQANADAASTAVQTQTNTAKQNQQNVTDTATKLNASMQSVTEGLSKLASGGLKNTYDGLIEAGHGVGGAFSKLADSLESVPIIGWILSIIDVLKDGLSNLVGSLLDSVLNAVSGIISDVLSGNLVKTIVTSVASGVGNILDALTFGIFSSNGNADEVNDLVERLTESNKYLATAIEKLTDEMQNSGGAQSTEYFRSAYDKQKEKIENDRQMLEAKMGYHSAHHSNDYYIGKDFSAEDWKKASDYIGKTLKNTGDLWRLSPEDLARLQELPDIWAKINGGKYDQSEWLDEYISDANTLIELQQQWQDAITDTSFDNIKSGMKELLADFKTESKDVIASVDEFMKNAILKSIVDGTYSEELKKWQEVFAEYMSDGILTKDEADTLRKRYQDIFDTAKAEKDAMFDAAGITDETDDSVTQSGKTGAFSAMSQDQGTKLEGLFTSGLIHWSSLDEKAEDVTGKMDTAEGHLAKIEEYTGDTVKSVNKVVAFFEKLYRDGIKLRST